MFASCLGDFEGSFFKYLRSIQEGPYPPGIQEDKQFSALVDKSVTVTEDYLVLSNKASVLELSWLKLDLDDDVEQSTLHKLERSIKKRKKAEPVRFVHDKEMPADVLDLLKKKLHSKNGNGRMNQRLKIVMMMRIASRERCKSWGL